MSDPLRTYRRALVRTWLLAAAVLSPIAWWALKPLSPPAISAPTLREPDAAPKPAATELIVVSDFDVRLWHAPPATPAVRDQAPPSAAKPLVSPQPPTVRFQLVGIIDEPAFSDEPGVSPSSRADPDSPRRLAAIYDPESDTLFLVASGQRVGATTHTVEGITTDSVTLISRSGAAPTRLTLRAASRGGTP